MPGPIGLAGMNARRGEVQAVGAADAADVPFCLCELYMIRDRGFCAALLNQARAAGCAALAFTVDMPLPGTRWRHRRSGLAGRPGWRGVMRRGWQGVTHPSWAVDVGLLGQPHHLADVAPALNLRAGLEDFLGWMRKRWPGPLIVKGVLGLEDAPEAAAGADGIVVSNHGGRQLDGVPATADALPAIAYGWASG